MFKILSIENLVPNIYQLKVEAPAIARKARAGQFIILRVDDHGERIPLTIADWDREEGSVTCVFNRVGHTTRKLAAFNAGDSIQNFVGPLGKFAPIENFGTAVLVVGGYATAAIVPTARALKEAGNRVVSIIRAPSKETLFGKERLGAFSDEIRIVMGDIDQGIDGFIIEPLREIMEKEEVGRVITIGPTCVMKLVSSVTRPYGVKTLAALNPIMIDGTGMCGVCRVVVGGITQFACVDGPEFDAHEVDWDILMARRCTYAGGDEPELTFQCRNCAQW